MGLPRNLWFNSSMDSFFLKSNEFEANIREVFKELREIHQFDVTMATDDGHQIQAHKIVLIAGSKFFKEILRTAKNKECAFIYLKGIEISELKHIVNFLYEGEVHVDREDVDKVLETAKELKITGLDCFQIIDERSIQSNAKLEEHPRDIDDEYLLNSTKSDASFETLDELLGDTENTLLQPKCYFTSAKTLEEASDCSFCKKHNYVGKNTKLLENYCHVCSKSFKTRRSLKAHIADNHTTYTCKACGKTLPDRSAFKSHTSSCKYLRICYFETESF